MMPRLVLAPLLGITNATFRRIYSTHFPGFACALAPFITTTHGNPAAISHFKDILPSNNQNSLPVIPQLIGNDGPDFVRIANRLHSDFGFSEVNWNIGCPSGTVTAKHRGAGLLPFPDRIDAFLDHVCSHISCSLSIKMRIGMNDPLDCRALIPILNRYPITEITIHPRTGIQMYEGTADVEAFADFSSALTMPIIYNGDITTTAFARSLLERFPKLSGLMIGRGAIANPFLPQAIVANIDEQSLFSKPRLKIFHDDLVSTYEATLDGGAIPLLGRMKEIWAYWGTVCNKKAIKAILKARRVDEYRVAVEAGFGEE